MVNVESPEFSADINAERLQNVLKAFAIFDTEQRERRLPDLIKFIKEIATPEVMAIATHPLKNKYLEQMSKNFGPPFLWAISNALKASFKTPKGEMQSWEGGYTLVMIDQDGILLAAATNPVGEVYNQYGKNLFPYALSKAVFELHLNLADKKSGLDKEENFDYIESLGFEYGKDLFMGTNSFPNGTVIGASGCELSRDYVNSLLPESMRDSYPVDFLAGAADRYFARMVAAQSMFHTEPHAMEEPKLFAELRRAH